jgi:hypothetical protein
MQEGQLRELAKVPEEKRVEVLKAAVEAGQKPTAPAIRRAKGRIVDGATGEPEPEPKCCPSCGQRIRKP